jgi:hypothetical protein
VGSRSPEDTLADARDEWPGHESVAAGLKAIAETEDH